jgi:hypothetical protein
VKDHLGRTEEEQQAALIASRRAKSRERMQEAIRTRNDPRPDGRKLCGHCGIPIVEGGQHSFPYGCLQNLNIRVRALREALKAVIDVEEDRLQLFLAGEIAAQALKRDSQGEPEN